MLKTQLRTRLARWVRGGGLRPVVAITLLMMVFVIVPSHQQNSQFALASNADQPRYVDMLCDNWGVVFDLLAPTQTSPTVTNYEYAYSTTQIIAEPSDLSFRALSPADATSPIQVSWNTLGLPQGVLHYFYVPSVPERYRYYLLLYQYLYVLYYSITVIVGHTSASSASSANS